MSNASLADRVSRSRTEALHQSVLALRDRPAVLGYLLMLPAASIIIFFVAYPFGWGVWMSLTNKQVGMPWSQVKFTGLQNYIDLVMKDGVFWTTAWNSFVYTGAATVIKWILGIWLAVLLNRLIKFQRILRAAVLLPWIVPTVLST